MKPADGRSTSITHGQPWWSVEERHGAWQGSAIHASRATSDTTSKAPSSHSDSDGRRPAHACSRVTIARATVHIHCGRVDFEKWQALGNDYLIVEQRALGQIVRTADREDRCVALTLVRIHVVDRCDQCSCRRGLPRHTTPFVIERRW